MTNTRLSDTQFNCLWALALGSKGTGSNPHTLTSLRRRGLATVRQHQGEPLWETTTTGEAVLNADGRRECL